LQPPTGLDVTLYKQANAIFEPTHQTEAYAYGIDIDGDNFFRGTTADKCYLLYVHGDRSTSYVATGDSNDAYIRVSGNNYAANDANFILRGINIGINNRSGGTLGMMNNSLGCQQKSGGTCPTIVGLTVTPENYGTCATEFGGIDIVLKNEGAVATTEYGLRIRNLNNSIADAIGSAILVTDTGANTGFDYIINTSGASITAGILNLADDGVSADAGSGTIGSAASGAWIRVKVGDTHFKIQLYADS
jgi:hypothetical protein